MGGFLIVDSVLTLLSGEHPSIGMVELFDWQVWLGWLMIGALVWSAIPALILGRMKLSLAAQLHDKVLHADAKMNKADWMTASAALVGVIGIGFGLWWLDAVAAILIGADILHDGITYTRAAAKDLLDGRPSTDDEKAVHPLVGEVRATVAELPWVREAAVRMRELGHVFSVEVLAVPRDEHDLLDRVEDAVERIATLDWKLGDVVVAVVRDLDGAPPEVVVTAGGPVAGPAR
jgi:divalent metal cation (Fe/Co/Zn/Cd) transporter